jgi:hypothetical protein
MESEVSENESPECSVRFCRWTWRPFPVAAAAFKPHNRTFGGKQRNLLWGAFGLSVASVEPAHLPLCCYVLKLVI